MLGAKGLTKNSFTQHVKHHKRNTITDSQMCQF